MAEQPHGEAAGSKKWWFLGEGETTAVGGGAIDPGVVDVEEMMLGARARGRCVSYPSTRWRRRRFSFLRASTSISSSSMRSFLRLRERAADSRFLSIRFCFRTFFSPPVEVAAKPSPAPPPGKLPPHAGTAATRAREAASLRRRWQRACWALGLTKETSWRLSGVAAAVRSDIAILAPNTNVDVVVGGAYDTLMDRCRTAVQMWTEEDVDSRLRKSWQGGVSDPPCDDGVAVLPVVQIQKR